MGVACWAVVQEWARWRGLAGADSGRAVGTDSPAKSEGKGPGRWWAGAAMGPPYELGEYGADRASWPHLG